MVVAVVVVEVGDEVRLLLFLILLQVVLVLLVVFVKAVVIANGWKLVVS